MSVHPLRACVRFVTDLVRLCGRHNVPRAAAALSYYFVLSVFPLLICVNAFLGLAHGDLQPFLLSLERVLPRDALELVRDYVDYAGTHTSPALLYAAVPAILLSASAALRVLLDTMDELFDHPRDTGLRRIALSVLFSLFFLAMVYLSILVILSGDWLFHWLEQVLALPPGFVAVTVLWSRLRYVLLLCIVILMVMTLYRVGTPRQAVRTIPMLVCALLASAALVVTSAVFSWLVSMSSRYSLLYGSLASLIILLVWLFLCGMILLLGAALLRLWLCPPNKNKKPPVS